MQTKNSIPFLAMSTAIALMMLATSLAAQESNCPDPVAICAYYHPGSDFTAGCEGPLCFSKNYAESVIVIATDDSGLFPVTWNLWAEGELLAHPDIPGWACFARANGNLTNDNNPIHKYKVTIPDIYPVPGCRLEVHRGEYIYHQHFLSRPATESLCWGECRLYVGVTAGTTELRGNFLDEPDADEETE